MLDGRPFTVLTDHKLFTYTSLQVSDPWIATQRRQLSYVAKFTSDIRYIPGSANDVEARGPSLGATCVKVLSRSQGYHPAGRQAKIFSTFTSWWCAWRG
jgi:hypothetical protein